MKAKVIGSDKSFLKNNLLGDDFLSKSLEKIAIPKKVNNQDDDIDFNDDNIEKLYIHFDVKEHCISVSDFIETIKSTEIIVNDLALKITGQDKCTKVYVFPPENGSLLVVLGIAAKKIALGTGIGVGIKYISKEVETFVEELTGYKNGDFGKNSAKILKECTKNFMEKSKNEIEQINQGVLELDTALKAKTDFYQMCSNNKDIKGIGFTSEPEYPIKRSNFYSRITPSISRPLPIKEELKELIIVKPVNTDEDLQWDFKDKNTKESLIAKMEDESFKRKLLNGECPQKKHKTPDVIIAKVEYHKKMEDGKERKNAYIITDVYKFNRKKLKDIPNNLKLNKIKEQDNGQLSLLANKKY